MSEILIKSARASKTFISRGLAVEGDPIDARVLQIEIFPSSPILPMGHINMERFNARSNLMTVNLDIFPASTPEDEIKIIRRQMSGIAEKHGKSQKELSRGACRAV